jgi:hypothetical protein
MQHGSKEIVRWEFTVHSIPGSPFGRAVMASLEEKGASYRLSVLAAPHANLVAWLARMEGAPELAGHDMGARVGDGQGVSETIEG